MNSTGTFYMNSAAFAAQPEPGRATLLILDRTKIPRMIQLSGNQTFGREYPLSTCTIRVESEIVGRDHGEFALDYRSGSYYFIDHNSQNGTFINGQRLVTNGHNSPPFRLTDGDIIRIDRKTLNLPHPEAVLMVYRTSLSVNEKWLEYRILPGVDITIGRDPDCSIVIDNMLVSRLHALIRNIGGRWVITDNRSTNGVSINSFEIDHEREIFDHDVIRIADTTLIFLGDRIIYNAASATGTSLLVDIEKKTVNHGRKTLLRNIRAEFENGDFVLILGGSGAGKTTLIRAILGESKADGRIILNGEDLYKNFKKIKSQIGLVPQFLTLRKNDTVRHTLLDTAGIKLGSGFTRADRIKQVEDTLALVGIKEHENKLIRQLSGGQQKKVSVANQLIGFQKIFICDEPDSGLDGASRMQQMDILKGISAKDKIVMVISHEPDDAVEVIGTTTRSLFTKVLVLARSSQDGAGHLAFFGSPDSALRYFGVQRLQDIMVEINPVTEGGKGLADMYISKFMQMKGGM